MSVLIKGMKMPKDCPMCPLAHWTNVTDEFTGCDIVGGKKYAIIKDKEYANSSTRPDWCPLVEVKTPHGRLFDETEVKKCLHELPDIEDKWNAIALLEWAIEKRWCIDVEGEE